MPKPVFFVIHIVVNDILLQFKDNYFIFQVSKNAIFAHFDVEKV